MRILLMVLTSRLERTMTPHIALVLCPALVLAFTFASSATQAETLDYLTKNNRTGNVRFKVRNQPGVYNPRSGKLALKLGGRRVMCWLPPGLGVAQIHGEVNKIIPAPQVLKTDQPRRSRRGPRITSSGSLHQEGGVHVSKRSPKRSYRPYDLKIHASFRLNDRGLILMKCHVGDRATGQAVINPQSGQVRASIRGWQWSTSLRPRSGPVSIFTALADSFERLAGEVW